MEKKLLLLDGHALVYRAHFAFINRPLINSKGLNTSAIAGFVRTLWDLMKNQKPTHIGVAFDLSGPTFRHAMYEPYKANRDEQPEDIGIALTHIKEIVKAFNIPIVALEKYEADDVIGTLAKKAEKEGFQVFMVTPDKDYAQLVSDNIFMYKPGRQGSDVEIYGIPEIKEKWGIKDVDQVRDILGLQGDSSDNIPGVPGVGPKTASKLLQDYDSIEQILENTDKLKGKLKERIEQNREQALLSKELATIIVDCPVEFDPGKYKIVDFDRKRLTELFKDLEFRTLAHNILQPAEQLSLFNQPAPHSVKRSAPAQAYSIASEGIKDYDKDYRFMSSSDEIEELISILEASEVYAVDTETTGLDTMTAELVGLSFSTAEHQGYYVPVPEDQDAARALVARFSSILTSDKHIKVGQNIKYDMNMLRRYGVEIQMPLFDTMIAHYLLEPDLRHRLDYLSETYLDYKMIPIEKLIGKRGKNQLSMRDIEPEKIVDYAAEDADVTLQLYHHLLPLLKQEELYDLFLQVEMPLVTVLSRLENHGIKLDSDHLHSYSKDLAGEIQKIEKNIYGQAGVKFNIASPKQVGQVLFDKLEIPYRWKKTASGQYSTNEEKLSELAEEHEIVRDILMYRKYSKLKSTYVDALPLMVNEDTGRIHSSFNQARAATGRLSSENPNLQNIPIRDRAGREIRNAFVPRDKDHILLAADYSQIELRLISDLSGDEAMKEAFIKKQDIHRATAARVYGVPYEEVTADQRRNAKTVNFSIIYGAGATNLSRQLDISRGEAKDLIDAYFKQYAGLKAYMDKNVNDARETGYVKTLMGRKRLLRDIDSRNGMLRSNAERMAINTPVQGTAADMIKVAMIEIDKRFHEEKLASQMILQVHDELVFDVLRTELERVQEIVSHEMETAMDDLGVPIVVEMDTGETWLEAH